MKRTGRRLTWLAAGTVTALTLTACGSGGGGGTEGNAPKLGRSDINATAPGQLRDGGTFRWTITNFPQNLNYNQFDGSEGDNEDITDSFMPQTFLTQPDGTVKVDKNYMESIQLTSTNPQVVTYTINPQATWTDGSPITWRDFRAQWQALNGSNEAYNVSTTTGYEDIASVERGTNDRQAVVTFDPKFADWKSLFDPLYPASTNSDPNVFNSGWLRRPQVTSGPFRPVSVDQTAKQIIVERNPDWWGPTPRLDRIIFKVVDASAQANALANNEVDFYEISSIISKLERAQQIPGVEVRKSVAPDRRHMTFNGGQGSILADRELRIAIQKGINRRPIAQALLGRFVENPQPQANHIFQEGQQGYQDNDQIVSYDPQAAERMLDELGWTRQGDGIRSKDGKQLVIRNVIPTGVENSEQEAKIAREQLRKIGVDMQIQTVPVNDFFEKHILVGDFDVTNFSWLGTAFPVSSTQSIYTLQQETQQNFGSIGNEKINRLYQEAIATLDEQRKIELANQIDTEIWKSGHSLMLYQRPNVYAVRQNVANFGAFGFADEVYTKMGFMKGQ